MLIPAKAKTKLLKIIHFSVKKGIHFYISLYNKFYIKVSSYHVLQVLQYGRMWCGVGSGYLPTYLPSTYLPTQTGVLLQGQTIKIRSYLVGHGKVETEMRSLTPQMMPVFLALRTQGRPWKSHRYEKGHLLGILNDKNTGIMKRIIHVLYLFTSLKTDF